MLDFSQVAVQIETFAGEQITMRERLLQALHEAGRRFQAASSDWDTVRERIESSHTSWMPASFIERAGQRFTPLPTRAPCTVLAADGSQIVADRHDMALCYLLNIGFIALRYGTGEAPTLISRPFLASPDDSLRSEYHADEDPIAPKRLATRRLLAEMEGLAQLIGEERRRTTPEIPMLALFDGTLILWTLEPEKDADYRLSVLDEFQKSLQTAREHRVPLAGYISRPMSRDVVNALRIQACSFPAARCDTHCPDRNKPRKEYVAPPCAGTEQVTDAQLFEEILAPGERSAVFGSASKILRQYAPENCIDFFYLNTGQEVARIEIPHWISGDPPLLEQTHSLCYDQAQKGDGYPVALAEAHEQAIVRGAERAAFFALMERKFVTRHLPVGSTQKSVSKRARRV